MAAIGRFLIILLSCLVPGVTPADERPNATARLEFMSSAAASFALHADGSADVFELRAEPLLRWNNAISGVPDGGLFLWTEGERPAAVVKFYQRPDGRWLHNLQSLSAGPFAAYRGDELVWNPRVPGVRFEPIPDAQVPANTSAVRKLQLRKLAGEFQLQELYQEQESWELRQLTTPLLRYVAKADGVLDGGMFAFTVGTNPEALLLIEARTPASEEQTQPIWMYAFAPLTGYAVSAEHRGIEVWSAERRKLRRPITEAYTSDDFEALSN